MRAPSLVVSIVTLVLLSPSTVSAQAAPAPPVSPEIQSARRSLGAHDWEHAIDTLTALVEEEQGNGQAWFLLGRAFRGHGDWEDALGAFQIAAETKAFAADAHFEAARLCAEHGEDDDALEHVRSAVEAGFAGSARWTMDAAFDHLRADARFTALVPPLKPSSECFVERPRVIHTFYGEAPGDVFGWIARDLGDSDGDGVSDFLISAPFANGAGAGGGKIYVYSGKSGALLYTHEGPAGEGLGMGIEAAGDVDGDGLMDAIAGAPNIGVGPGNAYVYSGKSGKVLLTLTAGKPNDELGRKVSGGVDFDGDGHDDVLVGAPGTGADGKAPGTAYLYSGKTGEVLATFEGERPGDRFGVSNAVWEGGGLTLIAIGAGNAGSSEGDQRGRVYVYTWKDGAAEPRFTIESDETGSALGGMFVCFPGDMDGDGISEVYGSDWQNNAKGAATGRIYVVSGRTGEPVLTLTGDAAGDGFGTCTADVGDVDGDGLADLLVGAWQVKTAAPGGGQCTLYSSAAKWKPVATYTCTEPGETFGFDSTGVGDVDGDGGIDFLVTGGYSTVAGTRSGRVFVIAGPLPTAAK